jgi:hypothetical protein
VASDGRLRGNPAAPAGGWIFRAFGENTGQLKRHADDQTREGAGVLNRRRRKMQWFLRQVPRLWLFFTVVIIAAVLYSIYQSKGMN